MGERTPVRASGSTVWGTAPSAVHEMFRRLMGSRGRARAARASPRSGPGRSRGSRISAKVGPNMTAESVSALHDPAHRALQEHGGHLASVLPAGAQVVDGTHLLPHRLLGLEQRLVTAGG